jgi:hypothetical protein
MSNRVNIEPTEFKDVRTGTVSYGVRVYDDYAMTYDNSWDDIPYSDLGVLKRVLENAGKEETELIDWAIESGKGIYVSITWFSSGDILQAREEIEEAVHEDQ